MLRGNGGTSIIARSGTTSLRAFALVERMGSRIVTPGRRPMLAYGVSGIRTSDKGGLILFMSIFDPGLQARRGVRFVVVALFERDFRSLWQAMQREL